MTSKEHEARCMGLRGAMTLSEAAIIADLEAAEKREAALVAALEKYGWHKPHCRLGRFLDRAESGTIPRCDCGFQEAKEATP